MSATKNYSVRSILKKSDEVEIQEVLKKHPLWKLKHARAQVAMRKFQQHITDAGK